MIIIICKYVSTLNIVIITFSLFLINHVFFNDLGSGDVFVDPDPVGTLLTDTSRS